METVTLVSCEYAPSGFQVCINGPYCFSDATFFLSGSSFTGNLGYSTFKEYPTRPTKRQIREFKRELRKAPKVDPYEFD